VLQVSDMEGRNHFSDHPRNIGEKKGPKRTKKSFFHIALSDISKDGWVGALLTSFEHTPSPDEEKESYFGTKTMETKKLISP